MATSCSTDNKIIYLEIMFGYTVLYQNYAFSYAHPNSHPPSFLSSRHGVSRHLFLDSPYAKNCWNATHINIDSILFTTLSDWVYLQFYLFGYFRVDLSFKTVIFFVHKNCNFLFVLLRGKLMGLLMHQQGSLMFVDSFFLIIIH